MMLECPIIVRDVSQLQTDNEPENIRKVLKAVGESKLPLNKALINEIKVDLVEKGYDVAVVHAEQAYLAEDVNAEIVRVLTICRHQGRSPEEAALVIDTLSRRG
jgi:hypothetical protein